jgi:hypothetical protein
MMKLFANWYIGREPVAYNATWCGAHVEDKQRCRSALQVEQEGRKHGRSLLEGQAPRTDERGRDWWVAVRIRSSPFFFLFVKQHVTHVTRRAIS